MRATEKEQIFPRFSEAEYARRRRAVIELASAAGAGATIVYGNAGGQFAAHYVSNFAPRRDCYIVLPNSGEPTMFVQLFNHWPNCQEISTITDTRFGGASSVDSLARHIDEIGLQSQTIAVIGAIPYQQMYRIKALLPGARFVDISRAFSSIRQVKSAEELSRTREACELTDLGMEALETEAHSGMSEHEWAALSEAAWIRRGGVTQVHYMASTSMHDPKVCVPAQWESSRIVAKGDVVITEFSAQFCGCSGQLHRPITVGEPPTSSYQRLYDVAVEAFERISAVIRPGATVEQVLDAAQFIHRAGLSIYDDLVHGYVGGYLDPVVRTRETRFEPDAPFTFQKNMILVIQPNVITPDERSGLQVGSAVLVTDKGVEVLQKYPMKFLRVE